MTFQRDNEAARLFRQSRPNIFEPGNDPRVALRQTAFEETHAVSRYGSDHRTAEEMKSDLEQGSDDYREASRQGSGLSPSMFRSLTGDVLPEEVEQE